jgi:hypothetical protein
MNCSTRNLVNSALLTIACTTDTALAAPMMYQFVSVSGGGTQELNLIRSTVFFDDTNFTKTVYGSQGNSNYSYALSNVTVETALNVLDVTSISYVPLNTQFSSGRINLDAFYFQYNDSTGRLSSSIQADFSGSDSSFRGSQLRAISAFGPYYRESNPFFRTLAGGGYVPYTTTESIFTLGIGGRAPMIGETSDGRAIINPGAWSDLNTSGTGSISFTNGNSLSTRVSLTQPLNAVTSVPIPSSLALIALFAVPLLTGRFKFSKK